MFGIENSANNFGRSAGLLSNTASNLPIRAALGTLFIASDTLVIYRWNGTAWDTIGGGGGAFNGAENGLSVNFFNKVVLGGTLTQNTDINCLNYGFKFEVFNSFAIGDGIEPTMIFNSSTETIITSVGGNNKGLYLDFLNNQYNFGDFTNTNSGTTIVINDLTQIIQTQHTGSNRGLKLDFGGLQYWLGDYDGITNGYWLQIDDTSGELKFNGANLISATSSGNSGQHLVIVLNGSTYKIKLENP